MSKSLYTTSKYYRITKVSAVQIVEPIGYHSLYGTNKQQEKLYDSEAINFDNIDQYIIKTVYDQPIFKHLSYRTNQMSPQNFIQQNLKLSQLQRKNQYLSSSSLESLRKIRQSLIISLNQHYFPTAQSLNDKKSIVQLSQIIYQSGVNIFQIQDLAVSRFFMVVENSNLQRIDFLYDAADRQLLSCNIEISRIIHDTERISKEEKNQEKYKCLKNTIQYQATSNFVALEQILGLIKTINDKNKQIDPFYQGVHFYFADYSELMRRSYSLPLQKRQITHLPALQYFLLMLTGLLANNQSALLRFQGTFQHKTIEFLFFLKLIFHGKITIIKAPGSNLFAPYSYVYCENYIKSHGDILHQYVIMNFGVLYREKGVSPDILLEKINAEEDGSKSAVNVPQLDRLKKIKKGQEYLHMGDQSLLIDPKKIVKDDLSNSVLLFNDKVMYRGLQINFKDFDKSSKILYYPSKNCIQEKLKGKLCKDISETINLIKQPKVVNQIDEDPKNPMNQDNTQKVAKQADLSILSVFSGIKQFRPVKKKNNHEKSKEKSKEEAQKPASSEKANKNAMLSFLDKFQMEKDNNKSKNKSKKKQK